MAHIRVCFVREFASPFFSPQDEMGIFVFFTLLPMAYFYKAVMPK